jgi:hypothetical protein
MLQGVGVKWSWEQLLAILQALIPPMSAKSSTIDDPTNFSAFKITSITKEIHNFETDAIEKAYIKLCLKTTRICTQLQC